MKLSDETYGIIEQNYGSEVAEYAKNKVEDRSSNFPDMDQRSVQVGLEVVMDQYLEELGEEDLEYALESFQQDLEETRRRGVLELLSAKANEVEL